MTSWQMYWLLMLDNIKDLMGIIVFIFAFVCIIGAVFWFMAEATPNDDDSEIYIRAAQTPLCLAWAIWILAILSLVFLPTTRQMAAIIVVPKIINNKDVQKIPENILKLANGWIDEKTKELNSPE